MVINQWLPAAHSGDAIGDSARETRDIIRRLGHPSEIFALDIDDAVASEVRPFDDPASRSGDVTILHYALASPLTEAFAALSSCRVLQYHNITPAHFFAGYDAGVVHLAAQGRRELAALRGRVDFALGDSEYNRLELERLGFAPTAVLPVAVRFDRLRQAPPTIAATALERALDTGVPNVLFVGRIVPNKRIEDFVRLAAIAPGYQFVFVGRHDVLPRYYSAIQALVARLGVPRERLLFAGAVSERELGVCYRTAAVYLSLSEHEGFCVPLLEAMAMDVPVVAYGVTAVPETLGGAGVQFAPKDLAHLAALIDVVVHDRDVRQRIIEGQRQRVAAFGSEAMTRRVAEVLHRVGGTRERASAITSVDR